MPNPKGHVATLKPFKGKWNSGQTQVIRVPKALSEQILSYARALDEGSGPADAGTVSESDKNRLLQVIEGLEIVHKFPRNNFSRDRKAYLRGLIDQLRELATTSNNEAVPNKSAQEAGDQ